LVDAARRSGAAGINLWTAKSVLAIEGDSERFYAYIASAAAVDPGSPRLVRLRDTARAARESASVRAINNPERSNGNDLRRWPMRLRRSAARAEHKDT
jgi:hypothetical protein